MNSFYLHRTASSVFEELLSIKVKNHDQVSVKIYWWLTKFTAEAIGVEAIFFQKQLKVLFSGRSPARKLFSFRSSGPRS